MIARALQRVDGAFVEGAIQRIAAATVADVGEIADIPISQRPAATALLADVLSRADDLRHPRPADWFGGQHVPTWILRYAHAQIGRMVVWSVAIPAFVVLIVLGVVSGEWVATGYLAFAVAFVVCLALLRVVDLQRSAIDAGVAGRKADE